MTEDTQYNLGRHEMALDRLARDIHKMQQDIEEMRRLVSESKGAWKMLAGIAALSSGVTTALLKAWAVIKGMGG